MTIANSTIANNSAAGAGGGVDRDAPIGPGDGSVALSSTIVSDNEASEGPDLASSPGAPGSYDASFSLIEDADPGDLSGELPGTNRLGVDPDLKPLAAVDGPTPVHLPRRLSPALDAGIAGGLEHDQRGFARSVGLRGVTSPPGSDRTDIGSAELRFPRTRFDSGPRDTISKRRVKFTFSSITPGATFQCSFDNRRFEPCTSPFRTRRLSDRYHQLEVRATTADGLFGRTARRGFVVDTALVRPRAKAKRVQHVRKPRALRVRVQAGAGEDVLLRIDGKIEIAGSRRVPLSSKRVAIPGRQLRSFNLAPRSARASRLVHRALRRKRKVVARVYITMTDRGSHRARKRLEVRLRR